MESHSHSHRIPLTILGGFVALGIAAGSGIAIWNWNSQHDSPVTSDPATIQETTQPPANSASQVPVERTVQLYWLKTVDNRIEVVASPVTIEAKSQTADILEAAIARLLEGNNSNSTITTIPEGTQLRSVAVEGDLIRVDLSAEFTQGGGSTSMSGRVAQILYTATTLDPSAKLWISVEGEPLDVLGGEGLILDNPLTRQEFEANFQL